MVSNTTETCQESQGCALNQHDFTRSLGNETKDTGVVLTTLSEGLHWLQDYVVSVIDKTIQPKWNFLAFTSMSSQIPEASMKAQTDLP